MLTKNASKLFAYNMYGNSTAARIENASITTVRGLDANTVATNVSYIGNDKYRNYMHGVTSYSCSSVVYFAQSIMSDSDISHIQAEIDNASDTYVCANATCGMAFGTGNTPPTVNDYKLSGDFVLRSKYNYTVVENLIDNGEYIDKQYFYTITNISDEPITIGEIGVFTFIKLFSQGATGEYSNQMRYVHTLIERTAFENPITIEPDGVGQVTYTLRLVKYIS